MDAVSKEAQGRALSQALEESGGPKPYLPEPLAPARTTINPEIDFPYGFYNKAGFDLFSQILRTALRAIDPDAKMFLEGSSVTGRGFERIASMTYSGKPFDLGPLSDYDVSIVSQNLYRQAAGIGAQEVGGARLLNVRQMGDLGLRSLDEAARAAVLETTGFAHPVNFKIFQNVSHMAAGSPRFEL
jgi:hypothetical protein